MHVPTHALLSWLLAEAPPDTDRRERCLVLAAGLAPDLDGLTILGGAQAFQTWHHVIHNGLTAVVVAALAAAVARRRRLRVAGLALVAFHLHLLCDLVGSAGPDGSLWSVPYLSPFVDEPFVWRGQWGLASWQNVLTTIAAMAVCAHLGAARGRTILEAISLRADAALVEVLRRRWPLYRAAEPVSEPTT